MNKKDSQKIKDAAICFSGLVKNLELCYPYIKKNLLNQFKSYDIFCCVEDDKNAEKIEILNPTKISKIKSSAVDQVIKRELCELNKQNYKKIIYPQSSRFNFRNIYQQLYKIKGAYELLQDYMNEQNISYKYFIRIRFDLLPLDIINPKDLHLKENEVLVHKIDNNPSRDEINDMFCITQNFETFKTYCTLYDNFKKIALEKVAMNPHPLQRLYFLIEKYHNQFLFILFNNKLMKKCNISKKILGLLLIPPKKIYKKFKDEHRSCLERVLFYYLKSNGKIIIKKKINFVIVRDILNGLMILTED